MAGRASGTLPADEQAFALPVAHYEKSRPDPAGQFSTSTTGLVVGTHVLTLDGELPVEHLSPGDRIISRNAGTARLQSINFATRRLSLVKIMAGSLGHKRPESDTFLPPDQRLLLRDWRAKALFGEAQAMVPVRSVVDDRFVSWMPAREVRIAQLTFEAPQVIYAGGLELGIAPESAASDTSVDWAA